MRLHRSAARAGSRASCRTGSVVASTAALAALLAGCSGGEEEPSPAPPAGAAEDLDSVPQEWLDGWCEARGAADEAAAVDLLGEPTDRVPALGEPEGSQELVWSDASGLQLVLVTDPAGAVVDRSSSVPTDLPPDAQDALDC